MSEKDHKCYMEEQIEQLDGKVDKMDKKLDKVVDAITGDEMGNPGIINTQKDHDKRISNIESIVIRLNVEKLIENKVEKNVESKLVKKYKLTKKDGAYLGTIISLAGGVIYTIIELYFK